MRSKYTRAVKMLLAKYGRNQTWLAEQIGMSKQNLNNIFSFGDFRMSFLNNVAKALEIDVNEIINLAESIE